jgi:phosphorylase/glycogen(starch) synthase
MQGNSSETLNGNILTHNLHDAENDPILNRIRKKGLTNQPDSKIKVVFVPSYLNGDDGISTFLTMNFSLALTLRLFPSYYEPWGYTPLESIAFSVPTITTSLSGFGLWVRKEVKDPTVQFILLTVTIPTMRKSFHIWLPLSGR